MLAGRTTNSTTQPFEAETRRAVQQLKRALSRIIESLPGDRIERPAALARALDLDMRLAWKISKMVETTDVFAAAQYVPGDAGQKIFLRAAERRGPPKLVIAQAKEAFRRFREVMRVHCGDRQTFNSMLAGHSTVDRARADLSHRKGAFRHNSFIWGVQTRTQLHTYILQPSKTAGFFDAAALFGYIDLRWIRPNVAWRIRRLCTTYNAQDMQTSFAREPLVPARPNEGDCADLPLLHEFCSHPMPPIRRLEGPEGHAEYQFVEGSVGNAGCLTCVMGEVVRAAEPRYRDARHSDLVVRANLRTPCEELLLDLLVHRDLFGRFVPAMHMFSNLFSGAMGGKHQECDRLPTHQTIDYLGAGVDVVQAPGIPRYTQLIEYAFDKLGWPVSKFDVYRLRVPFPPIPSAIEMSHLLPEAPHD